MKTMQYPLVSCIKNGFEDIVCFDGVSKHGKNYFIHKLDSGTKIATLEPTPMVKRTQIWGPASQRQSKRTFEKASEPLTPRTFDLQKLSHLSLPHSLLETLDESASIRSFSIKKEFGGSAYIKNTDGDEVWFVYKGAGWCETELGQLFYKSGDYLYIPKSFRYKINPQTDTLMIGIESVKALLRPCFADYKIPYDTNSLLLPSLAPVKMSSKKREMPLFDSTRNADTYEVYVKKSHIWTRVEYDTHPNVECIGYKGTFHPFILDSDNIINDKILPTFLFISEDLSVAVSTFAVLSTLENITSVGFMAKGNMVYSLKEYFYDFHQENTSKFLVAFEARSLFISTHKACEIEI